MTVSRLCCPIHKVPTAGLSGFTGKRRAVSVPSRLLINLAVTFCRQVFEEKYIIFSPLLCVLYAPPISLKIWHWRCERFSSYPVFPISAIVSLLQTHISFIFHQQNLTLRTVNFCKRSLFLLILSSKWSVSFQIGWVKFFESWKSSPVIRWMRHIYNKWACLNNSVKQSF